MTGTPTCLRPHVRWMIRRDMPTVLEIEASSFGRGWTEEDFCKCLRDRSCIGFVAVEHLQDDDGGAVIGYVLYELYRAKLDILKLAVAPDRRRRGVGGTMVEKLMGKLSSHLRTRLTTTLPESNLAAQLFYRSLGFRAVAIRRECYIDNDQAGYVMAYDLNPKTDNPSAVDPDENFDRR